MPLAVRLPLQLRGFSRTRQQCAGLRKNLLSKRSAECGACLQSYFRVRPAAALALRLLGQMSLLSDHGYPQHSHGVGAGTGELRICSVDGEVAACLDMQEREERGGERERERGGAPSSHQELQEMVQTRGDTVRALKAK